MAILPAMPDAFVHGVLAGYGIAIPVGAIAVLIVGVGIRCGFACGASAGAGAATADGVYATVAATAGAAAAAVLEPWAVPIRWMSGLVLIALAVYGLARARRPIEPSAAAFIMRRGELVLTYSRFLGLTIINPMTVVYFGTMVLGAGVGATPGAGEVALFAIGAFAASLSWQTLLAGVGAIARHGLPARFQWFTAVAGNIIILILAARIILAASA
jgi:arginine exporter protein ArgO